MRLGYQQYASLTEQDSPYEREWHKQLEAHRQQLEAPALRLESQAPAELTR